MYPRELNYTMPAEWEQHERTFMSWPVKATMCHPEDYEAVCKNYYAELVKAITEFEPVTVIVNPDDVVNVLDQLEEADAHMCYPIEILTIEHNDAWLRDNGPTFVVNDDGKVAGISWRFNAWGGKYSPWEQDDALAGKLLAHYDIKQFDAAFILEGGSIHTDGDGTLLTTEECLLNENRNVNISKEQIEQQLQEYLNIDKVIWLKNGLDGDETDGHIDNIACFAAPGKVILQVCDDKDDPNYQITQDALQVLENTIDAKGRKIEVIKIKQPPKRCHNDERLTLSYLNFYFVNDGIILPVFGGDAVETDELAIKTLQELYPEKNIRTVDGMAIIKEGGNVHCTTQQMPATIESKL
jgi:agmatine deiminase